MTEDTTDVSVIPLMYTLMICFKEMEHRETFEQKLREWGEVEYHVIGDVIFVGGDPQKFLSWVMNHGK